MGTINASVQTGLEAFILLRQNYSVNNFDHYDDN